MGHDKNRGKDLDTAREALGSWRRLHGGRGRPIPEGLWSDAAEVARANGVAETARALRLNPRKLAKLAEGRVLSATVRSSARGPGTRARVGRRAPRPPVASAIATRPATLPGRGVGRGA